MTYVHYSRVNSLPEWKLQLHHYLQRYSEKGEPACAMRMFARGLQLAGTEDEA